MKISFGIQFSVKAGDKALTAKDRSLTNQCASLLLKICQKYDNIAEVTSYRTYPILFQKCNLILCMYDLILLLFLIF